MSLTEDLTGRALGNYELRERVGRGGMAEVYKAHQRSLDRFVAVKVLHSFLSEDQEFKERFEREAKNIARLRHNHIVQVYDFAFEAGPDLYYMVMEFIEGPTLRNELLQREAKGERLPVPEVIRIARDVASALAYARENGMIHRDIKPGNIMLDRKDKRVVLTDFGIAKIISGQHITASGTMIGTPAYMAPEQGLGQPGDHRSDIYSLGVVMFQMAAGTPPYEADTPIALVLKHVNDPLPPLSTFNPNLPEGLERIVYKCLAKDPDERFQKAEELIDLFENVEAAAHIQIPEDAVAQATVPLDAAVPKKAAKEEPPTRPERTIQPATLSPLARGVIGAAAIVVLAAFVLVLGPSLGSRGSQGGGPVPPQIEAPTPSLAFESSEEVAAAVQEAALASDLEGTALVATIDTFRALRGTQNALATRPVGGTDLAPLIPPGCDYDYETISQEPANNALLLEHTTVTKRIVVSNTGDCPWEAGATFAFLDGVQMEGPDGIAISQRVAPGEQATLEFQLLMPAFSVNDRVVQSTWRLTTSDGQRIGRLFTFNIELVPPTATPTPSRTPSPSPMPSATPTITPTVDLTARALAQGNQTATARAAATQTQAAAPTATDTEEPTS